MLRAKNTINVKNQSVLFNVTSFFYEISVDILYMISNALFIKNKCYIFIKNKIVKTMKIAQYVDYEQWNILCDDFQNHLTSSVVPIKLSKWVLYLELNFF